MRRAKLRGETLTREQENLILFGLIKKTTLDEYVVLFNIIGEDRLSEALIQEGPNKKTS